jgi:hypothetical protein
VRPSAWLLLLDRGLRHPSQKVLAFLDNCHKVVDGTFTGAHWGFIAVGGDGLIRKNSDPNFSTALDVAGHSPACGFYLAACNPGIFQSLKAETSKRDKIARHGFAFGLSSMMFSVLNFLWD